ncbi:EamA family transporter [Candidatus Woesearchaeota archaeon]|nr:EamA family transporter [Candidatus Woesearchaeota archaeon]
MEWYVLLLISAFIFGVSEIFKKKVLYHEHTLQFMSSYYLMMFVFLLVLLPKVNFHLMPIEWFIIVLKSSLLAIAAYMIFKLLRHYDISEILPLKNLSPVFLLVLGYLILNEHPSAINIAGIVLLIAGTYVLEADHKISDLKEPLKVLSDKKLVFLLTYLIFISFCAVIDKIAVRTIDVYSYYFLQMMFLSTIFLALKSRAKGGLSDIKQAFRKDWPGIIVASLLVVLSDLLYLSAISLPATLIVLAIPIRRLSTFISAFIGGELFHEKGLKMKLIACSIMIAGAWLVVL